MQQPLAMTSFTLQYLPLKQATTHINLDSADTTKQTTGGHFKWENYSTHLQHARLCSMHRRTTNNLLYQCTKNPSYNIYLKYLTVCYRGDFPQKWKKAIVLPLLKSNKDPTQVTCYRPISLTSALGKIYEKIMARHLT